MGKEIEKTTANSTENTRNPISIEYERLLARRDKLNTSEKLAYEEQEIQQITDEYQRKIDLLSLQVESLEAERDEQIKTVQKERETAEEELVSKLRQTIYIGPASVFKSSFSTEEYQWGQTFGFDEEEAIELLKIALENKVDIESFLGFCEFSRRCLEYRWEESGSYSIVRHKEHLFPASDVEIFPHFQEVEKQLNVGFDILFGLFVQQSKRKGSMEQAMEIFNKTKTMWNINTDSRINSDYSLTFTCFLDFLASDQVNILKGPTYRKFHYDFFSYKLK